MAVKTPLPSKYKASEKAIFKLVSTRGVSKVICISKLGLQKNYFNQYQNTNENFESALAHFTSDVLMVAVTSSLEFSASDRKYIMTKLRIFDSEIDLPIKNMKTASHASQNLSFALNAYAKKEIGEDTLQSIRQACDVFSNLMVATTLQQEVKDLQKLFEEKFNEKH